MSFQVTENYTKQYHDTFERLLGQQGSKFLGHVRKESQKSESQFFNQIGLVEAEEIINQHGDSPQSDTPHLRRRVTLRFFDVGDYIDDEDKARGLPDPTSEYTTGFVDALNRKRDDIIVASMWADAQTGKEGTTAVAFTSGNEIAANFGTFTGLSVKKLIEARRLLIGYENDLDRATPTVAIGAAQVANLLNEEKFTNSDYASKALVDGKVVNYLGFNFIHSQRLTKVGNDRYVPVWMPDGILHTVGIEVKTRVAERSDKRFNMYAYAKAGFGATRMQENKVIRILCTEPGA
jgi:hypothetical protein